MATPDGTAELVTDYPEAVGNRLLASLKSPGFFCGYAHSDSSGMGI
jgi:hypothetical protein